MSGSTLNYILHFNSIRSAQQTCLILSFASLLSGCSGMTASNGSATLSSERAPSAASTVDSTTASIPVNASAGPIKIGAPVKNSSAVTGTVTLTSPSAYQVFMRDQNNSGFVTVAGNDLNTRTNNRCLYLELGRLNCRAAGFFDCRFDPI